MRLLSYGPGSGAPPPGGSEFGCRKTVRIITLRYFGDIDLARYLKVECVSGEAVDTQYARGTCEGGALGCQIGAATGAGGAVAIDCTPTTRNMSVKVYAAIPGITGAPGIVTASVSNPQTFPGTYNVDATGSYEITGSFEEWECWDTLGADRGMPRADAYDWPLKPELNPAQNEIAGYGDTQGDGLKGVTYTRFLVARIGTPITVTVTVGGATASNSVTITPANQFEILHSFGGGIDYGSRWVTQMHWSGGGTGSASVEAKVQVNGGTPVTLGANGWNSTKGDGWKKADASFGSKISALAGYGDAECQAALFPVLKWDVDAHARCFLDNYPDAQLKLNYIGGRHLDADSNPTGTVAQGTLAPDFAATVSMPRYAAEGDDGGSVDASGSPPWISVGSSWASTYTDQWWPQRLWLNEKSMKVAGGTGHHLLPYGFGGSFSYGFTEDTRDWDVRVLGQAWPVFSLARSGDVVLSSAASTDGWVEGADTTVSVDGGRVKVEASGGTGSAQFTVPAGMTVWEYFRYLRLNVQGSVSMGLTVDLAGQSWPLVVTTGAADKDLDLTLAGDETATSGGRESRFPVTAYEGGWGVDEATDISINGIPDGETLWIGAVKLHLSTATGHHQRATFLDPFRCRFLITGSAYAQDFGFVETDGRESDRGLGLTVTSGIPSWATIANLKTSLQVPVGLTLAGRSDPADGFHNASFTPALKVGDSTYHGAAWHHWVEVDISSAATFYAQDRISELDCWPFAGDFWETGDYSKNLKCRAMKRLRAKGEGLVFTPAKSPSADKEIEIVQELPGGLKAFMGSGTSGALGYFSTGTGWAFGGVNDQIRKVGTTSPHVDKHLSANRKRHRAWFYASSAEIASAIGYDIGPNLLHYRTTTPGSVLTVGVAQNVPMVWTDVSTGLTACWTRCRYPKAGQDRTLSVVFGDGSDIFKATTRDRGTTMAGVTNIGSGTVADFDTDTDQTKHFVKVLSSDGGSTYDLWYRREDALGNELVAWTITDWTGVDNAAVAVKCSIGSEGRRIGVLAQYGGTEVWKQSKDGLHYT